MKLLYITYKVDSRDTLVGYVVGWLQGLAKRMESVDVICLSNGEANLSPNVRLHSLGKDRGAGRIVRALKFLQLAWSLSSKVDAVFCQFSPEYVIAVSLFAKLRRLPIMLWYTHRHVSWRLKLATLLADRIVTASAESFQLKSNKVRVIGHGIDTACFAPTSNVQHPTPKTVLAVGRRAPIKNYELLIAAAQFLPNDARVRIVGGDEGNAPRGYVQTLQEQINALGLSDRITLVGAVGYDRIPFEYQQAAVHVNLCPTGGLDKAVLEGMACGAIALVRNETFRAVLGDLTERLIVASDDPKVIAARIETLLNLPDEDRRVMGERLREIVVNGFGEEALTKKLAEELASLK
ncbi:MAG: glycosyltransferase family 4 protein [Chloroflexi bacterium]|nr:glycosyltransferase family 4 protein [Chloroflexota bacterium]